MTLSGRGLGVRSWVGKGPFGMIIHKGDPYAAMRQQPHLSRHESWPTVFAPLPPNQYLCMLCSLTLFTACPAGLSRKQAAWLYPHVLLHALWHWRPRELRAVAAASSLVVGCWECAGTSDARCVHLHVECTQCFIFCGAWAGLGGGGVHKAGIGHVLRVCDGLYCSSVVNGHGGRSGSAHQCNKGSLAT